MEWGWGVGVDGGGGRLSTSITFTTPLNISAELKSVQKLSPATSTSCSSAQKGTFGLITAWYFQTQRCPAIYFMTAGIKSGHNIFRTLFNLV